MLRPIIYIHGYGSSGNTDTAKNLRHILADGFEVISPTYDWSAPAAAAQQLTELYSQHAQQRPIIVGTSLGGFFANYVARVCHAPAILVNPSVQPSASLHKYGESESALAGYAELEASDAVDELNSALRIVVIGTRDNVVDPRTNGLTLKGNVHVVMLDMGHRIEPAYYGTIAGLVRKLASD